MFELFQLQRMNGASNKYYDWGGKDGGMFQRAKLAGFRIFRPSYSVGKFYDINGIQKKIENEDPYEIEEENGTFEAMQADGLQQVKYRLLKRTDFKTFVHLLVVI